MANMMKMLKQAQSMQLKMKKMQEDMAEREVEFSSGGGMVTCRATCDGRVSAIRIDPGIFARMEGLMKETMTLLGGGKGEEGVAEVVTAKLKGVEREMKDMPEMLEDLVLSAVKGALKLGTETMSEEMGKITKGMNIPGMEF